MKGNQEDKPAQYLYYPNGKKKALLVHILGTNDCPQCWERELNHYTDGNKVYKRIIE